MVEIFPLQLWCCQNNSSVFASTCYKNQLYRKTKGSIRNEKKGRERWDVSEIMGEENHDVSDDDDVGIWWQ